MQEKTTKLNAILLGLLSIVSILTTCSLYVLFSRQFPVSPSAVSSHSVSKRQAQEYTYVGDDFPIWLPTSSPLSSIQMISEESVHYTLSSTDDREWLYNSPYGRSTVRLGPNNRGFLVTMFHQMHCLRHLQSDMHSPKKPGHGWGHATHCLNYLRQTILCAGDLTLESGDFSQRNFTQMRMGERHVCRDWEGVYGELKKNAFEWYAYKKAHDLTDPPED